MPAQLRNEHYLNLVPYGWNIATHQAGMKNLEQVRDKEPPPPIPLATGPGLSHPFLDFGANESIAHTILP
jgi:hypothetical protein